MPRLHFDLRIEDPSNIVDPPLRHLGVSGIKWPAPKRISHRQPNLEPEQGPVIGVEGDTKWRVTVAGVDEVTCLDCGETYPKRWRGCPRCNEDATSHYMKATKTVPTLSYLRPGEYEIK